MYVAEKISYLMYRTAFMQGVVLLVAIGTYFISPIITYILLSSFIIAVTELFFRKTELYPSLLENQHARLAKVSHLRVGLPLSLFYIIWLTKEFVVSAEQGVFLLGIALLPTMVVALCYYLKWRTLK